MTILRKLRASVRRQSPTYAELRIANGLPELSEQTGLAELERKLDIWTRWAKRSGRSEVHLDLATASLSAEKELRTFFGSKALQSVQSCGEEFGDGTTVFAADRLFVAFLGRRAAMAVTRKVSSNLS